MITTIIKRTDILGGYSPHLNQLVLETEHQFFLLPWKNLVCIVNLKTLEMSLFSGEVCIVIDYMIDEDNRHTFTTRYSGEDGLRQDYQLIKHKLNTN